MKVGIVDDPQMVRVVNGYKAKDQETGEEIWIEGECRVLREDVEAAKDFARELMRETNPRLRQQWEHDYYADLKERYCSAQVAGAMLMKVWDWTKEAVPEEV